MKPLVYKGLRKNLNRSEWVSSDEIKQSYSQIRLLSVENDTYAWLPIEEETQDKLIPLVEEIELFVKGTRAQGKLWNDELADDAVEGETFHINDLVQEGEEDD